MKVDFHIHSDHSDGTLSVEALIALARDRALKQFSITDHDTIAAYNDLAGQDLSDLRVIVGCEFSAVWRGRTVHILGLNLDLMSDSLRQAMRVQAHAREDRAQLIADILESRGVQGSLKGAQAIAGNAVVGRPHFAKFLLQANYVKDERQAFKKYLGRGKPGDIKTKWCSLQQVVGWVLAAEGIPVLAHPEKYGLTQTKLRELISDFKEAGGLAMEVVTGSHQSPTIKRLAGLSSHYGLKASAGSDFHRPGQSWADIGNIPALPDGCDPVWELWSN